MAESRNHKLWLTYDIAVLAIYLFGFIVAMTDEAYFLATCVAFGFGFVSSITISDARKVLRARRERG